MKSITFAWGGAHDLAHIVDDESVHDYAVLCGMDPAKELGVPPVIGRFPANGVPLCARCFAKWWNQG